MANDEETGAAPRPIPGGIQPFGPGTEVFHLFLPEPGAEPSSITDFKGTIGVAAVQGKGTSSDGKSWLYDTDLRFMQGVFIGKDGERHRGTFGFVWLDLYEGQFDFNSFSTQRFDFDLGIEPDGLFWTAAFSRDSVSSEDVDEGSASMDVTDLDLRDFHSVPNALMRGSSDPATVSFEVEWKLVKKRGTLRDSTNKFSVEFVETDVTVEWSAEKSNFSFESEPNSVQPGATPFSIVGRERNGVFFE